MSLSTSLKSEILEIAKPKIERIKNAASKGVLKQDEKWHHYVSPEWLFACLDDDVCVASERNYFSFSRAESDGFIHIMKRLYPGYSIYSSGHFYYPKTGYMGWHTNSSQPDKHVYIVYASEDKQSFFRYYKDDEVITHYDDKGLNIREFDATAERPFFWHCVGSECDRFSFGFRLFPSDASHNH